MLRKNAFIQHLEHMKPSLLDESSRKCANNPDIINLGTAEAKFMNDLLMPILHHRPELEFDIAGYGASFDDSPLRNGISKLYNDYFGIPSDPSEIMITGGVAIALERLSMVFCEPGETILIAKPCYGCFEPDMFACGAKVEFIDLNNLPPAPPADAKLLLLTNPGNPIGKKIADPVSVLKWAYQNPDLHILTDDIYALSNRVGEKFQSIAGLPEADPMKVHQVYGLSKDWGLAGFHISSFYSRNEELRKLFKMSLGTIWIASDTIQVCSKLFSNIEWRDNYIKTLQERLKHAEQIAKTILIEAEFKILSADNSLFIMIDLTDIAGTPEKEYQVWETLIDKYRVHMIPGNIGFHYEPCGWYRICFSSPDDKLIEGLKRLIKGVKEIRKSP